MNRQDRKVLNSQKYLLIWRAGTGCLRLYPGLVVVLFRWHIFLLVWFTSILLLMDSGQVYNLIVLIGYICGQIEIALNCRWPIHLLQKSSLRLFWDASTFEWCSCSPCMPLMIANRFYIDPSVVVVVVNLSMVYAWSLQIPSGFIAGLK